MSSQALPVLIIGAGPSGLTLAQALRKQDIPFRIFERDSSAHSREQGWALGLHSMLDDFTASMPEDVPSIDTTNHLLPREDHAAMMVLYPPAGETWYAESTADHKIIRATRSKLIDILRTNLDIEFGKKLEGISQDQESATVTFSDGSTAKGSVIVGADGVGSHVRRHILPDVQTEIVPETFITGGVTLREPELSQQISLGRSAYVRIGPDFQLFIGLSAMSSDGSEGRFYWHFIYQDPGKTNADVQTSAEEQLAYAKERTKDVEPELTAILYKTKAEDIHSPPLILRDAVIESMPVSRVTLMGDAAHPMTPFRGEGGCNAIQDALNLARALKKASEGSERDLLPSLEAYQSEMLKRGANAVRKSRGAGSQQQDTGARMVWGTPVKVLNRTS